MTQSSLSSLSYDIIGATIEVHNLLGPGLLEAVYEHCLAEELRMRGMQVQRQVGVPLSYKGEPLNYLLRIDLLVNDCIIVEVKAADVMLPVFKAQLLSYMKLAEKPKGLLINFHSPVLKHGVHSLVTDLYSNLPE